LYHRRRPPIPGRDGQQDRLRTDRSLAPTAQHLVEALGLKGISKNQVSRICKELDAFQARPLDDEYPCLMLDATFEKVRQNGRAFLSQPVSRGMPGVRLATSERSVR
jgi:hypothetical protein